jgi:hypothetical protein
MVSPEFAEFGIPEFLLAARRQIEQDRQDAGDVAESRRPMKEPGGITLAEIRKKLRR